MGQDAVRRQRQFGARLAEFERDLRLILRRISPGGQFTEVSEPIQLIVWARPADD